MELNEALLKRRSVRKFTNEVVSVDAINELMHAAMSAPSAMNSQPWEFFVIQDKNALNNVIKCMRYANYGANTAIIVAGNSKRFLPETMKEFWVQDCSAATENILLRAVELGLGTVWCGAYPNLECSNKLRLALGANENIVPMNVILVGYPDENPEPRDQFDKNKVHII